MNMSTSVKQFNEIDFIIAYEEGGLDEFEIIEGFQKLINNGNVWRLQGHYGRQAQSLINAGLCQRK